MSQQDLYGPPPTHRPSTPVPPLPSYGGRRLPPVPAANRPAVPPVERYSGPPVDENWARRYDAPQHDDRRYDPRYAAPRQDNRYDDRYDERHDQGWADEGQYDQGWDDDGGYEPGYDDYAYDDAPSRTNTMAILGLVFAFIFSPLGIVFSAIGLSQTKRRYERGRGLAITGLVLSIVFLVIGVALAVFMFLGVSKAIESTVSDQSTALSSALGADDGADSVLTACQKIMPAFTGLEQQMTAATTPDQMVQSLATVRTTMGDAVSATSDATFVQQVQKLAGDLQQLETALTTGQVPADIEQMMTDDGFAVGTSCGLAGWTP